MSITLMAQVWKLNLGTAEIGRSRKLVLMALADHANDEGYCYPSAAYVGWKTCYSERQVQRILDDLESEHIIRVAKDFTPTTPRVYQLTLDNAPLQTPYARKPSGRGDMAESIGVTSQEEGVTSQRPRGDIAVSPEPSLETSNNHHYNRDAVVAAVSISPKAKTPDEQKVSLTFNLYQQMIGMINPRIAELVREDIENVPIEWIQKAFDHMALANVKRWDYVKKTLENWQASGGPQIKANGNSPPDEPHWSLVNGEWQPPSQGWVIAHLIGDETYAAGLKRLRSAQALGVKT